MSFLSIETRWRHRCRGRIVLPICGASRNRDRQIYRAFAGHDTTWAECRCAADLAPRSSVCPRSEEHTSELQSIMRTSSAVFCLKKNNNNIKQIHTNQMQLQNVYDNTVVHH